MENYIELCDLLSQLRDGLEEQFPDKIWIRAELASIQARANGHCYMELSQSSPRGVIAKARAVIWKGVYGMLARYFRDAAGSDLTPGMDLLLQVQVSYSEIYGLSLVVHDIDASYTVGAAEMEKRRTIERLTAEGMMDRQQSLQVPQLPYRLAVISARDAAGYGDFCRHLQDNEYGFRFDVQLFEATMQGESAPASITDALCRVESSPEPFDVILIMRGGGSVLDLACFDDYGLCLGIACCSIPVYTAIGHDRDYHVADMVAHAHVKTPTALADEMLDCLIAEDSRLSDFAARLRLAISARIATMEARLAELSARISSADPRSVLARGYSLVTDSRGVVIKSAAGVSEHDRIEVMFADGILECEVQGRR